MTNAAKSSKAKVVVTGMKGAGFRVLAYEDDGTLPPWGETQVGDYAVAMGLARQATDLGRIPLVDETKSEAVQALPDPPALAMQRTRRPAARKKAASARARVAKSDPSADWSGVASRAFDAIDLDASTSKFFEDFREKVQHHDAAGHGKPVAYTQSTHNALKESLLHGELMREAFMFIADEMLARIARLESALTSAPAYRGVWRAEQSYPLGSFVTHDGSVWHANAATSVRPGDGSADWTLAVKRGAPGKGA